MKRKGFAAESTEQRKKAENQPELTSQVAITLLLTGGQQYTVTVMPDDPLLHDLYETLVASNGDAIKRLFQIPIHNGRAVLAFPSDRLVGLITEPPLIIEHTAATPAGLSTQLQPDPCVSNYLQLDHFLPTENHQRLLDYVIEREAEFVSTTTFTGEVNYRESVVLYSFPEFSELVTQRIHQVLPQVFDQLGIVPFPVSQIEAQLTAHNDGQFYKVHNDNGSHDTATRELTYVYYFYREPKPFSGGELVIYDSAIQNNYYVQADTFKTVEPRNNSIVFFLSRYMHEVLPIRCPSQVFADSRFTINGWIRR